VLVREVTWQPFHVGHKAAFSASTARRRTNDIGPGIVLMRRGEAGSIAGNGSKRKGRARKVEADQQFDILPPGVRIGAHLIGTQGEADRYHPRETVPCTNTGVRNFDDLRTCKWVVSRQTCAAAAESFSRRTITFALVSLRLGHLRGAGRRVRAKNLLFGRAQSISVLWYRCPPSFMGESIYPGPFLGGGGTHS